MHSIGKIVISQHRETPEAWTIVDFQNGLKKHGLSVYYKNSDEYRRGLCRKLRQYDLRKSASTQNYEAMTLTEIKRLCSERNISQSSRKSWEELRDELVEEDRRILAHLMAKTLPLPAAMALKGIPGLAPPQWLYTPLVRLHKASEILRRANSESHIRQQQQQQQQQEEKAIPRTTSRHQPYSLEHQAVPAAMPEPQQAPGCQPYSSREFVADMSRKSPLVYRHSYPGRSHPKHK